MVWEKTYSRKVYHFVQVYLPLFPAQVSDLEFKTNDLTVSDQQLLEKSKKSRDPVGFSVRDNSQQKDFAFLAKPGPLKQVLAPMEINHTVMNPGWDTANQRTLRGPRIIPIHYCVIENEDNFKCIDSNASLQN